MGDVKLAGVMGLFLGRTVAPAILIALLAGVICGALIIARKGAQAGRKTAVPFGPFLAMGAIVAVYAGQPLITFTRITFCTKGSRFSPPRDRTGDRHPFAQPANLHYAIATQAQSLQARALWPMLSKPSLNLSLGRRSGAKVVGLDIQPGHIARCRRTSTARSSPNMRRPCRCPPTPSARARYSTRACWPKLCASSFATIR